MRKIAHFLHFPRAVGSSRHTHRGGGRVAGGRAQGTEIDPRHLRCARQTAQVRAERNILNLLPTNVLKSFTSRFNRASSNIPVRLVAMNISFLS